MESPLIKHAQWAMQGTATWEYTLAAPVTVHIIQADACAPTHLFARSDLRATTDSQAAVGN